MKKILVFAMMIMALVGCSNSFEPTSSSESYTDIQLAGDVVTSAAPLTRASSANSTYYAFQVYRTDNYGEWEYYAYGIFKDMDDFSLKVDDGRRYKVKCICIEELTDKVDEGLYEPFSQSGARVTNKFIYGGNNRLSLNEWNSVRVNGQRKSYAGVNYFYGIAEGSGTEGIRINMQRHNVGLRFCIVAPDGGSVRVTNRHDTFPIDITTSGTYDDMTLYSVTNERNDLALVIETTYADGSKDTKNIDEKWLNNKIIYTISISKSNSVGLGNIALSRDYGMAEETIIIE